jgi:hypothetical protein
MTAVRPAPPGAAPRGAAPQAVDGGFGARPTPRRSRNLAGALLGALLIVGCAAAVALYAANVGHRHAVLVVARPVKAGTAIRDADLGEARISNDPSIHTVAAGDRARVVGRVTAVNLIPGTLLSPGQLATGPRVDPGSAVVGLALKAGQFPAGLRPVDNVTLVRTTAPSDTSPSSATNGSVLADRAQIFSVDQAADGQTTIVSVIVPSALAPTVASASARAEISVVLLGGAGGA